MTEPRVPIAIVGASALFPGSCDLRGFWRDILGGTDRIGDVPATHWLVEDYYDPDPRTPDKTYAKRGGFLDEIAFDPVRFGVPPGIIPATDSSQLLALIVAQNVLDDACAGQFALTDRDRVSVILGVTSGQELLASMVSRLQRPIWSKSLREAGIAERQVAEICDRIADHYVPWQEASFPGLLGNVVAGRIANRLDLGGTNCVVDAACASALSALAMAVNELCLGDSDLVITGGVDTLNDIFMFTCFSKTPALSPTGDCRPFSDRADGTLLGEGLGMVALKRLIDAERDGNHIYAVIRGVGTSSDGRATSVYAPRVAGQAKALRRAYGHAGYGPATVELVEAHGTGTKAGDDAELAALRLVFDERSEATGGGGLISATGTASGTIDAGGAGGRAPRGIEHASPERSAQPWCALGSIKSQIGHTKAAAGAAGLLKAVMALHHRVLPPTLKVERPNPAIEGGPFYLNTSARPWVRGRGHPRRASVSSFGFGGSNFHVALEEHRGTRTRRLRVVPDEIVVLGAGSAVALIEQLRAYDLAASIPLPEAPAGPPAMPWLAWLARRTQLAWDNTARVRLALIACDDGDLAAKLARAAILIEAEPDAAFATLDGIHYGIVEASPMPVAFVFPGQGSQYVGMGSPLAMMFDAALDVWDRAADLALGDARLDEVVFPRTEFAPDADASQQARLTRSELAQPAIGAVSLSMLSLLERLGVAPSWVAGQSFGELTALCAAGVFDRDTLLRLARTRGELMASVAGPPERAGAMLSVTADVDRVRAIVSALGRGVVIANHNAPRQVVLSGTSDAIAETAAQLAAAGVSTRRLPVAAAFHSEIVHGAVAPFRSALATAAVAAPAVPVFGNATAAPYPADPDAIRDLLAAQITQPVRFVDQVDAMYRAGARVFVEVGPRAVLTGLVGQILEGRAHVAIALDHHGKHGVSSWHDALARLITCGVALDLAPLWTEYSEPADPRTDPPKMTVLLTGTNYGKPYPPTGDVASLPPPNELSEVIVNDPDSIPAYSNGTSVATTELGDLELDGTPASPWIAAYQDAQRQTAEAHMMFLNAIGHAHAGFLRTAEAANHALLAMATGASPALTTPEPSDLFAPLPVRVPGPRPSPVPAAAARRVAVPAAPPIPRPAPTSERGDRTSARAARVAPRTLTADDLEAVVLEIVAEKTGYPRETLAMDMALEADLGIDSIKRVEILAELTTRHPDLPEVDPAQLGRLTTLGEIAAYMRKQLGVDPRPKSASAATP